jgi:hypothetical protein
MDSECMMQDGRHGVVEVETAHAERAKMYDEHVPVLEAVAALSGMKLDSIK